MNAVLVKGSAPSRPQEDWGRGGKRGRYPDTDPELRVTSCAPNDIPSAGARLHVPPPLALRCDGVPELWAVARGQKGEPQLPGPLKLLTAPSTQAHLFFPFSICPLEVNAKGDLRRSCWEDGRACTAWGSEPVIDCGEQSISHPPHE